MESYEMTGTPRQVIEDIRTTFDMTELEAELVALGALYNQDMMVKMKLQSEILL